MITRAAYDSTMHNRHARVPRLAVVFLAAVTAPAFAQQQGPPPLMYGAPIALDAAKKAAGAAAAEARKNNWMMAVAVVDTAGELVYFEKLDGTQAASVDIAIDKARSSARYKRPTKAFQDELAKGGEGLRFLQLRGVIGAEGGVPIVMGGRLVGAIGVSGGTGQQDGMAATAGAKALQ
jgi:uncharacterized protein GlcG (DUF336 family)